jgi:hypothetical protein
MTGAFERETGRRARVAESGVVAQYQRRRRVTDEIEAVKQRLVVTQQALGAAEATLTWITELDPMRAGDAIAYAEQGLRNMYAVLEQIGLEE